MDAFVWTVERSTRRKPTQTRVHTKSPPCRSHYPSFNVEIFQFESLLRCSPRHGDECEGNQETACLAKPCRHLLFFPWSPWHLKCSATQTRLCFPPKHQIHVTSHNFTLGNIVQWLTLCYLRSALTSRENLDFSSGKQLRCNTLTFVLHPAILQTVSTASELRKPIYWIVAAKAIDYEQMLLLMAGVKWDIREIMSQHNVYVDVLLKVKWSEEGVDDSFIWESVNKASLIKAALSYLNLLWFNKLNEFEQDSDRVCKSEKSFRPWSLWKYW